MNVLASPERRGLVAGEGARVGQDDVSVIRFHISIVCLGWISMVPEASAGPAREQEQPVILSMSYIVRLLSVTSDKLLILMRKC